MTSFIIFSTLVPSKMRFFSNFFTSHRIEATFDTGIQNWMLILIFGSKVVWGTISNDMTQKTIILRRFLAKRLLEIALQ